MIEQIKVAGVAAITVASCGASIITETTLLPLGIFVAGIGVSCIAAWRVAVAVTKASDRLARMEERIDDIEKRCLARNCNK